jgi:hypothetical protein|tara:strand:+ start:210 stop:386 length:177 start_codon:yes stop_codon:yes gene_type:complete
MKKIKQKLLTYLFTDWVKTEKDVETLLLTKKMIEDRKNEISGHTPILGFRMHGNSNIE